MKNKLKIKILKIFTIGVAAALVFNLASPNFLGNSTTEAVGDLEVIWGVPDGDPIFVVANMAPGDMETRSVDVDNNAPSPRSVGVRGVKTSETDALSTVLDIVISQGAADLYGGTSPTGPKTLDQFFTESAGPDGIALSTLGIGASTTYTFKVTFDTSAGNDFQATSVIFDLIIGISIDLPPECDLIDLLSTPIIGTPKAETLNGTEGNDLIIGLEGADRINGNGGNDCIFGNTGAETINGGEGNDVIFGQEHADTVNGNNGNDLLVGGPGADTLRGQNGQDHLIGNENADTLEGGNDNDLLEGNEAPDTLRGSNGDDELIGGAGIDTGNGGPNTDTCDAETETNCEL